MINIETATKEELLAEYEQCEKMWGKYSSDCFGFYIQALHRQITAKGGWPTNNRYEKPV